MGVNYKEVLNFYKDKSVLITGNTGFKGSWLTYILLSAGANVTGYSLKPPTDPSLFVLLELEKEEGLRQWYSDIRDIEGLNRTVALARPEIVFHLAAQPIVRESYKNPVDTYFTNVMGTVHICEAVRLVPSVRSFLNITTDKVYRNVEWEYGYREIDELDGMDPYSNSKSCSELVTHSYIDSFYKNRNVAVSTARAGNVIGGGDFSMDRIIPDCVRSLLDAVSNKQSEAFIEVRNPYSTRPYEHVLEPLFVYLMIAAKQFEDRSYAGCYNVGPDDVDCVKTRDLTDSFCCLWNEKNEGLRASWNSKAEKNAPHEANYLKLDCSRLKHTFDWKPRWHIVDAIEHTVNWTKIWMEGGDIKAEMNREIEEFMKVSDECLI